MVSHHHEEEQRDQDDRDDQYGDQYQSEPAGVSRVVKLTRLSTGTGDDLGVGMGSHRRQPFNHGQELTHSSRGEQLVEAELVVVLLELAIGEGGIETRGELLSLDVGYRRVRRAAIGRGDRQVTAHLCEGTRRKPNGGACPAKPPICKSPDNDQTRVAPTTIRHELPALPQPRAVGQSGDAGDRLAQEPS
jgi:hypothetical protein